MRVEEELVEIDRTEKRRRRNSGQIRKDEDEKEED